MSNLLNILPELQEKIFGYCYTRDIINLMSCNSKYKKTLKPILCSHIHISLGTLQDEKAPRFLERMGMRIPKQKKKLQRLQSARSIRIEGGRSDIWNSDGSVMSSAEWLDKMAANYRRVLSYCSPTRLEEVRVDRVITKANILYTCTTFTGITRLSISYAWHVGEVHFLPISQLQDLVHLDLKHTPVGRLFLTAISDKLLCLRFLCLHGCVLVTEEGLEMLKVETLRTLDVSGIPELADRAIDHISTMSNLKSLNMSHCKCIRCGQSSGLHKLSRLRCLDLSWCKEVNNDNLDVLSRFTQLRVLNVSRCMDIDDRGVKMIAKVKTLQDLSLESCVGVTDEGVRIVCDELPHLVRLHIGGTDISDIVMSCLNKLIYLEDVSVAGCRELTDFGLSVFSVLPRLRQLDMSDTRASAETLNDDTMTKLRVLNIGGCSGMNNSALVLVGRLLLLEELDISGNSAITDTSVASLLELRSLRVLRCVQTQINKYGVERLKNNLPNLKVESNAW